MQFRITFYYLDIINLNLIIVLTPRSTTTALKEENGRGGLNMITYSNIIVWHVIN